MLHVLPPTTRTTRIGDNQGPHQLRTTVLGLPAHPGSCVAGACVSLCCAANGEKRARSCKGAVMPAPDAAACASSARVLIPPAGVPFAAAVACWTLTLDFHSCGGCDMSLQGRQQLSTIAALVRLETSHADLSVPRSDTPVYVPRMTVVPAVCSPKRSSIRIGSWIDRRKNMGRMTGMQGIVFSGRSRNC